MTLAAIVHTINDLQIEFDAAKDEVNRRKHGLSLGEAARLDWDTVIAHDDTRRDYGEAREIGFGLMEQRLYCVVFVRRGEVMRIISFRRANRREVKRYG